MSKSKSQSTWVLVLIFLPERLIWVMMLATTSLCSSDWSIITAALSLRAERSASASCTFLLLCLCHERQMKTWCIVFIPRLALLRPVVSGVVPPPPPQPCSSRCLESCRYRSSSRLLVTPSTSMRSSSGRLMRPLCAGCMCLYVHRLDEPVSADVMQLSRGYLFISPIIHWSTHKSTWSSITYRKETADGGRGGGWWVGGWGERGGCGGGIFVHYSLSSIWGM